MFTGLVDDVGTLERVADGSAGRELVVRCRYGDLVRGESVAVSGACLTVRDCEPGRFVVAAVATTLERTAVGRWSAGTRVNLERALRAGDRLGGHLVQGHVDAVGTVAGVRRLDDATLVDIELPPDLGDLLVAHGSIAVDGVSLTVNAIPAPSVAQVSLIEYTRRHTTLGDLEPGDAVHVEGDVIGKYVRALLAPYVTAEFGARSSGFASRGVPGQANPEPRTPSSEPL